VKGTPSAALFRGVDATDNADGAGAGANSVDGFTLPDVNLAAGPACVFCTGTVDFSPGSLAENGLRGVFAVVATDKGETA
uniref:hypothetical protein n=1 Tax=Salmonella sp. SAL04281 TaxID=3159859 RepID=UPI003979043B